MKSKTVFIVCSFFMLLTLSACQCEHEWQDATCTTPKSCSKCEETEGEPLAHEWTEATCTTPKTCSVCSEVEGEPAGHQWNAATCTKTKTCSVCKKTEGKALGHKSGETVNFMDYVAAEQTSATFCSRCDAIVDNVTVKMTSFHDGNRFLFSIDELTERLNHIFDSNSMWAGFVAYAGSSSIKISTGKSASNLYIECSSKAIVVEIDEDAFNASGLELMISMMYACDPLMSADKCVEIATEFMSAGSSSYNGLTYYIIPGSYTATFSIIVG